MKIGNDTHKVILVGGNHHNGLGLVRSFGLHGIRPYGIIISDEKDRLFLNKSVYWEKCWIVKDENTALDVMQKNFKNEENKPIVIPYSDGAAQIIDTNYSALHKYFELPNLGEMQGAICKLMDKQKQVDFAKREGIPMISSFIQELDKETIENCCVFPVILKPVASIEGEKADICICRNQSEYYAAIESFRDKTYQRVLVQKYIENKQEFVLTGSICNPIISFSVVRHIRQWPNKRGSGSYSELVNNEENLEFGKKVLLIMMNNGFRGCCDIEFFKDDCGKYYLNEINWRSSGRNFVSQYNGVHSAYYYYCSILNIPIYDKLIGESTGYSMTEIADFNHVTDKELPLWTWLRQFGSADSYALKYKTDMEPVKFIYKSYFIKALVKCMIPKKIKKIIHKS